MALSPPEWRDQLIKALDSRWSRIRVYDAYYEGDQALAFMTRKFRAIYGDLFGALADNWCALVVDSSVERLKVQGFRFGSDQEADEEAWNIWQHNGLDAQSNMVHTEAVKLSEAYWLVQPPANGETEPRITAEHPAEVIVAHEPGDRRQRLAALKKWRDGEGYVHANVYLPDRVVKWRSPEAERWTSLGTVPNPLGAVPVVPMPNNPSMLRGGRSDLGGGVIALQDAINKLLCDLLIGSEFGAMPQRVLLGVEQPRGADGNPIPMEKLDEAAASSRLWMFPGTDAKAFEFSAADLANIRESMDGLVRDLTAQTRTPPHYVSGQIVNASGDALKAAETGLVSKVRDKMDPFGEGHEEMMRLAFRSIDPDDERAQTMDAEVIWKDPESRSVGEVVDAVQKQVAMGLPFEVALEKMGYSPQEIDRIMSMREAEALLAQSLPAPATPPAEELPPAASNGNATSPAIA